MVIAVLNLGLLAMLFPMNKLLKKAIKLNKLSDYFKKNASPRNSVRLFTAIYIFRSAVAICHGAWAAFQYYQLNTGQKTYNQLITDRISNETFLMLDELVVFLTMLSSFVFFWQFSLSMRQIKQRADEISFP